VRVDNGFELLDTEAAVNVLRLEQIRRYNSSVGVDPHAHTVGPDAWGESATRLHDSLVDQVRPRTPEEYMHLPSVPHFPLRLDDAI
jgi:hypothetical protein